MSIRILIVEDHVYTAEGLCSFLSVEDIIIVDVCASSDEALQSAEKSKPDIILLDLHLKNSCPAGELLSLFCYNRPWKVIVLSMENREAFVKAALEKGASAFLSKSDPPQQLLSAIRAIHNGTEFIKSPHVPLENSRLSPSGKRMLKLLGQGLKYHEIASAQGRSVEGVRKQCDRLQILLDLSSREQLIAWSIEHGYTSLD